MPEGLKEEGNAHAWCELWCHTGRGGWTTFHRYTHPSRSPRASARVPHVPWLLLRRLLLGVDAAVTSAEGASGRRRSSMAGPAAPWGRGRRGGRGRGGRCRGRVLVHEAHADGTVGRGGGGWCGWLRWKQKAREGNLLTSVLVTDESSLLEKGEEKAKRARR